MAPRLADTEPPAANFSAVKQTMISIPGNRTSNFREHGTSLDWRMFLQPVVDGWTILSRMICVPWTLFHGSHWSHGSRWSHGPHGPMDLYSMRLCYITWPSLTRSPRDQSFPFEKGILRAVCHRGQAGTWLGTPWSPGTPWYLGTPPDERNERQILIHTEETPHPNRIFHSEEKPNAVST